jgi:hypothetical protein
MWRLALCASLLAGVTASADDHPAPFNLPDRINVERRNDVLELAWMDTEDRLQGSITPDTPREGVPLKVTLHVGSFDGAAFDGPITLTLREAGAKHGQTVTVQREKGAVNWRAEFTPESTGPYQLDVSFRTTRLKVLHADYDVSSRPVPRFILWAIVVVAGIVAVGYGIRSLVRKDTSSEPHPVLAELAAMSPAAPASTTAPTPAPAPGSASVTPDPASPASAPADTASSPPPEKPSTL